jgi:ABC-2 type transport system permease protein
MPKFVDTEVIDYTDCTGQVLDSLKTGLEELGYDALVHISPLDTESKSVSVTAYSSSPMSVDMKETISSRVDDAVEDYRLSLYDIGDLKQIMQDVKFNSTVMTYTLGEDGEEKITSSEVYMIISLVLSMIIYFFVAMFSGMVMQSVIEEKASRVVEVLVSSVKATELMFGKIIGVACVALTQFLLWIILTAVIVTGISSFVGLDSMMQSATVQTEQMAHITDDLGVDPDMMVMTFPMPEKPDSVVPAGEDNELAAVLSTLKDLNYGMLLFGFFVYFALFCHHQYVDIDQKLSQYA